MSQVPWYGVLGNHDYGDGVAPGDPPPRCAKHELPWRCSAGPLTQASGHSIHLVFILRSWSAQASVTSAAHSTPQQRISQMQGGASKPSRQLDWVALYVLLMWRGRQKRECWKRPAFVRSVAVQPVLFSSTTTLSVSSPGGHIRSSHHITPLQLSCQLLHVFLVKCSLLALRQLSAELAARDARWSVRRARTLSLLGGAVDLFFYDTTPFVQYYYDREWASNPGAALQQAAAGPQECAKSHPLYTARQPNDRTSAALLIELERPGYASQRVRLMC